MHPARSKLRAGSSHEQLREIVCPWAWLGFAASIAILLPTAGARAFQNPDTFAGSPTKAGGGGRYFTGAPLDAYTCEVCHRSEAAPAVRVFGLPDGSYAPGALYSVTIDWPDDLARVALMMEMTDTTGHAIGTWSEPDPTTLTAADLCTLSTDTPAGTRIIPIGTERSIVSAIDCGQHQTTMNWTAPAQLTPELLQPPAAMLNGAIVASNTNGKLAGDSVAAFSRSLGPLGPIGATEAPSPRVGASCATATPHAGSRGVQAAWFVALLATLRRRARTQKAVR